ncbi:DUF6545 domain-containing protein [Nocardia vaccinii]|uniref:DUF6545 domain-containing protein n=1 Tax=Nocardia vaccinii TaxID=1822 RepID=UPI0008323CB6|nr:DUF6545 domain-containing protein [Nocardia vaccinii]
MRAIFAAVPLAAPWTIAQFCGWFGAATGLEVRVAPWRVDGAAPPKCAALVVVGGRVIVRFDERRSDRHKSQQIMHEFAHLLCDHLGDNKFAVGTGLFTRGLDLAKIGAVVQRQALDSESEVQAEIVGTHLAVMSHEVIRLWPAGASCVPAAIVRRGAKRRVQVLAPLWEALTQAAPAVRLCDALSLRSPAVAVHRMLIEMEDAVMTLASVLIPPGDGSVEGWVTSIADALVGGGVEAPASALGFSPQWPSDERVVLDIARAWMRKGRKGVR